MIKEILFGKQFKRDLKKQYLSLASIAQAEVLHHLYHALLGKWSGCQDCHVNPDLVLTYEVRQNTLVLSSRSIFG